MTSVIVIDDDKDLVDTIADFLKLSGFDVIATGCNGLDAVNLFQKLKPDCVLLDYHMPFYDGLYGLKKIRKISSTSKILLFTASTDSKIKNILLDNGANKVLSKLISLKDLCIELR